MTQQIAQSWKNGGDNSSPPQVVLLNNGHVLITSDADTDADGSPDAVAIGNGSGQLQTSLGKPRWKGEGDYVNARKIPYYVLPGNWQEVTGVNCKLGDIAKITYKNKEIYAIYADNGPDEIIGEASIAAVEALDHHPWNDSHTKIISGIPYGVNYEIIPGSSNLDRTIDRDTIQAYGQELFGSVPVAEVAVDYNAVDWLELNRASDGSPAITAYLGAVPKYTRYYKNKKELIEFLQAFPKANSALVAQNKDIPNCPDVIIRDTVVSSNAARFAKFFEGNYGSVRAEVTRWFAPINDGSSTKNACVAHQVSCLKLCNLPYPQPLGNDASINVRAFEAWALSHGWTKIRDRDQLKPGDLCVCLNSNPADDHVFCFLHHVNADVVSILDNQATGVHNRSLSGAGGKTPWTVALRMP
ncbi:hypothetical protein MICAF_7340001 [Microcystis aeruginosa PCC 9807]|uniref:Uncharacterized protein n=1 Tax=Microcystis aeruginosa PCC 9807 TaxID=1160283 RepID=I4HEH7_MICAE|nr:glycoside hydrolase family 75 protein [Microcystis aeruginosa]CCI20451.1 hypothetical protein MICAF_7340001 [Microcystis aeruginosa PCC 9807]